MDSTPDQNPPSAPSRRVRERVPSWFPRALVMTIVAILATLGLLWVLVKVGDLLIALLLALFVSFARELSLDAALEDFDSLGSVIQGYADDVGRGVIGFGSTVAGAVLGLLTMGLFTFYLLADGPRLRRALLSAVRPEVQQEVLRLWEVAIQKTGGYVYSRLLLALASAVFTYVVLLIVGVPFAIPLALWVGVVSQAIPAFGTYLAAIAPILVALFTDPVKAVWVLVALVAYQQIENFVLQPRITAKTMALHPAVAFGSVLAGAALLGAIGALIALPTAAIIQAFISTYIEQHEVIENALAQD